MKKLLILLLALSILVFAFGCDSKKASKNTSSPASTEEASKSDEKVPELTMSWGNELHTGIMNVATKKPELFKETGVYFNPLSKDKFELLENGKKIAILNFVPSKGGSETANLMSQGHVDYGFGSNTAFLTAVDNGAKLKIAAPFQSDGIALVFPPNTNLKNWDDIKKHILDLKQPLKLGYHSPVSGPRIVIESVLKAQGLKVTENPSDTSANVLLVDLKGSNNLLPSLTSKQVDAWVGPSHHPEAAEEKGLGEIALNLKDFPENGQWNDFPCCVFAATDKAINDYPEVTKAFTKLVAANAKYCTEHHGEVSKIMAEVIGVSEETINKCEIKYFTAPSENWYKGIEIYVEKLNEMDKFNGQLKGLDFEKVEKLVFDFRFLE